MKKIRVLIVDDSLLFREIFSKMLNSDPNIEVVATAADAFEARDKLLQYHPDVMTLDVQMPKMNGIEFLRRLMPQYPIPTIIISGTDDYDDSVFEAISLGAVDFVKKPDGNIVVNGKEFFDDLIFKVKIAAAAKVQKEKNVIRKPVIEERISHSKKKIVAIGASTGGTVAITNLLEGISPPIPPILIVQHIPPVFSNMFAQRLNEIFSFDVKEAESGDLVLPGRVLIAPGNKHMIAKKVGSTVKVECFEGEKVNGHCPAVDVLFDSMAAFGSEVVGVILTGIIVLIIGFTKFIYGAWLVVIFIPFMVKTFKQIKSHYMDMAEQLHLPVSELNPDIEANLKIGKNIVIMPIASPTLLVAETMKYAKSISTDILVINVVTDEATGQKNQAKWQNWNPGVELITIYSPYRMVNRPILNFINEVASKKNPEDFITVLIPEFETKKWWHRVLHNQTGFILRTLLILKENVIVTTIPFHLKK